MFKRGTGFKAVVQAVLASAFGVQSKKNQDRDFQHGKLSHYIVAGIIGTLLFILALVAVVKAVLGATAG